MTEAARRRLRDTPPDAPIRFETYQDAAALAVLLETGRLGGGKSYGDRDETWRDAYEWMRERMAEAIDGFSGEFPIWGWPAAVRLTSRELRWKDGLWRIRAIVPRGRVLPSCFSLWHHPLNGWSIDDDEAAWEANWNAAPEVRRTTWHKCLRICDRNPDLAAFLGVPEAVQLCLDGLLLTEVYGVTPISKRPA